MQFSDWLKYELVTRGNGYEVSAPKSFSGVYGTMAAIPSMYKGYPVVTIGDGAFNGYTKLKIVVIPESVQEIGNMAFQGCYTLKNITIPKSIKSIGKGAFRYCSNLRNITIPYGVKNIASRTFGGCASLHNVVINGNIDVIAPSAFSDCVSLENIVIQSGIKQVSHHAFNNCRKLKNVCFIGTEDEWTKVIIKEGNECLTSAKMLFVDKDDVDNFYNSFVNSQFHLTMEQQTNPQTLYIYEGNILCKRKHHDTISVTAKLHDLADKEVEINAEYCTVCRKFLLSHDLFDKYRKYYGLLFGDFRLYDSDGSYSPNKLAMESPLHLFGYNVNQNNDYSAKQRQYILARIIHDGIMTKQQVLDYLSYFVKQNKNRDNLKLAVEKWTEDIYFVEDYDIKTQPRTIISNIKRF